MTYANFQITGAMIRGKETFFDDMSDAELIALFKTEAKQRMKLDMLQAFNLDSETDADFEEVLTDNTERLQEALCALQLHLFFFSNYNGENTHNDIKAKYYEKRYMEYAAKFVNMYNNKPLSTDYIDLTR